MIHFKKDISHKSSGPAIRLNTVKPSKGRDPQIRQDPLQPISPPQPIYLGVVVVSTFVVRQLQLPEGDLLSHPVSPGVGRFGVHVHLVTWGKQVKPVKLQPGTAAVLSA